MTLPTPDPAFRWSAEPWGHALRCRPLERLAQHLFTTKQLKLRPSAFREPRGRPELTRATTGSGRPEALGWPVLDGRGPASQLAWAQATSSLGAGLEQLRRVKQVHGRAVRVLRKGDTAAIVADEPPEADALVSNEPGLVLAVQVADCVPVLLADRDSGAAGAVHAGWRGTCARVAEVAVETMMRELGTNPQNLTVAIGPGIGACCYEVGAEVLEAFRVGGATEDQLARWFHRTAHGSLGLDLASANRDQIHAAGVPEDHIFLAGLCTQTDSDVFDSFRAAGARAGRMAGIIRVPEGGGFCWC